MQKQKQVAGIVAVAATVLLTVLRLCFPPQNSGFHGNYVVTVCAAVAALLAVYILCGKQRCATRSVKAVSAKLLSAAMLFFGVSLCYAAFNDVMDLRRGIYPYPQPLTVTAMNTLLVWIGVLSALAGGVFFVMTAIRWYLNGATTRVSNGVMALLPVVWMWVRILWYMTAFASAANRFRSLFEIGMLLFEMVFLFTFARHLAGMEEDAPRFVIPTALSAAMLGLVVCFTRFAAYVMQDADLFGSTALLVAPDPFVAVLAGVFAATQLMPRFYREEDSVVEEEKPEELPAVPAEESDEEDDTPFLLSETDLDTPSADEEEDATEAETERKPLELEDIINEIINGTR